MTDKGKPTKEASQTKALVKKQNIPVQMTDLSIFDDTFVTMKERFSEEMKRVDQYMFSLSKALTTFYNQNMTVPAGHGGPLIEEIDDMVNWDDIVSSPLVEGEGEERLLKLQFNVSQYAPEEIEVKVAENNILTVSAIHDEQSETSSEHREYRRFFALPADIDPESIISSLSRDGILTVHAPIRQPARKLSQ